MNGDIDVPTDVVPFFETISEAMPALSLTDQDGAVIALRAEKTFAQAAEIFPAEALLPSTTYTLTAEFGSPVALTDTVTFATGTGPFSGTAPQPRASLQHYRFDHEPRSSCSPAATGSCLLLPKNVPVRVEYAGTKLLLRESWFTHFSSHTEGVPTDCVTVDVRAPNGTYGPPRQLCGAGAAEVSLEGSEDIACTSEGITQQGALVEPDSGCSFSRGPGRWPGDSGGAPLGLTVAGFLMLRCLNRAAVRRGRQSAQ